MSVILNISHFLHKLARRGKEYKSHKMEQEVLQLLSSALFYLDTSHFVCGQLAKCVCYLIMKLHGNWVFETCFSLIVQYFETGSRSRSISILGTSRYAYSLMCTFFRSILRRTKVFLKYWHAEKLTEQLQKAQEAVIKIQKGKCHYFEEAASRFYGEICVYLVNITNPAFISLFILWIFVFLFHSFS